MSLLQQNQECSSQDMVPAGGGNIVGGNEVSVDDDVSFMQLIYKFGAGGVMQLKKVDEISAEEKDDGWTVQDEWLEGHEILCTIGVRSAHEEAEAYQEESEESGREDAESEEISFESLDFPTALPALSCLVFGVPDFGVPDSSAWGSDFRGFLEA